MRLFACHRKLRHAFPDVTPIVETHLQLLSERDAGRSTSRYCNKASGVLALH
jgi:hypothetical protein